MTHECAGLYLVAPRDQGLKTGCDQVVEDDVDPDDHQPMLVSLSPSSPNRRRGEATCAEVFTSADIQVINSTSPGQKIVK